MKFKTSEQISQYLSQHYGHKPCCFDSNKQWINYAKACIESDFKPASYCYDCGKKYQVKMIKEGRCEKPNFKRFEVWEFDYLLGLSEKS